MAKSDENCRIIVKALRGAVKLPVDDSAAPFQHISVPTFDVDGCEVCNSSTVGDNELLLTELIQTWPDGPGPARISILRTPWVSLRERSPMAFALKLTS